MNLAAIDLNLLVAFDAILRERHVSRAAAGIGVSQPTLSHSLRRLRDLLGDELFYKTGRGMMPTTLALELGDAIQPSLAQIRLALTGVQGFDPLATTREFTLGLSDAGSFTSLSFLTNTMRAQAPSARVRVVNVGTEDAVEKLMQGVVELAVGLHPGNHPEMTKETVMRVKPIVVADRHNPRLRNGGLTLEDFLRSPHIAFTSAPGIPCDVDVALAARGLHRNIAFYVPHWLAIPRAVQGTDLLAVMETSESSWGDALEAMPINHPDLVFLTPPIPLPSKDACLMWPRRYDADAGHKWFRSLFHLQADSNRTQS